MTCRLYKGVAIVVAAKQNSLENPVASTTAPASIFSPTGKNPKNPLFPPPVLLIRRDLLQKERRRDARERSKAVPWTRKERRMMKQNSKEKEIEQDGNDGKENREQSSTAKQAHNQSATGNGNSNRELT
jgi:hypothetical protein